MSVKVTNNVPKILLDTQSGISLFLRYSLDDVDKNADPITPRRQGYLRDSTQKEVLGKTGRIKWNKVYAAAQEAGQTQGRPIVNYTTPGTGKKYAERGVEMTTKNAPTLMKKARLIQ